MRDRSQASADAHLPRAIAEHLDALGVAPSLVALVAACSAQRSIASHLVEGDYVAISPGVGGHISGYVHQRRLTLALKPTRADQVGLQHGWQVVPDSGITSYVKIPASSLTSAVHRTIALALILESLDWRGSGPHQATAAGPGTAAPDKPVDTCPIHFTQMLGGSCAQCD